jgi:hypothetical protein
MPSFVPFVLSNLRVSNGEVNTTMTEPSFVQLVTQALMGADCPLTVTEIKARVERVRPVRSRDPQATIRGAINNGNRSGGGSPPANFKQISNVPLTLF